MFTEFMIFMAFYAVALVAHFAHSTKVKGARDAVKGHRFALYAAVLAKAFAVAGHEYIVHLLVYSGYVIRH